MSSRRIAVIGGGISGLLVASELHRAGHEITLFEAAAFAGGHTNTIAVEEPDGIVNVDTGFIVLNDRNYPNFEAILEELDVPTQAANMSFGVSDGTGDFEWAARGARGIFAQPRNLTDPKFLRMLADLVRFNREARTLLGAEATPGSGPSLRQFLADGDYSDYFVERLIVPQASAVWSADPDQMWSFPAAFLAAFFDNHGVLQLRNRPQWRSIPGGSKRYVAPLTAPYSERIRLNTPVRRIEREPDSVLVAHDGGTERFDEVVIGTHSDQALSMLADPTALEWELLGAIPYAPNEAVLHTDTTLMPHRRAAWASWNFHLSEESAGRSTLTYDMNRLQALETDRQYLVTLNRTEAIDPAKIIRVVDYAHPVYTVEGMAAQQRWAEISGVDRIHFCGAYWRWGFHEDGAWSALRVSEMLGGRGPGLVEPAGSGWLDAEPAALDAVLEPA